jgi:hypothetical protein
MLQLLQAGIIAACHQLGAVLIGTLFVFLLVADGFIVQDVSTIHSGGKSCWITASPFLTWAYLLIATGLALTRSQAVDLTAERIRRATYLMHLARPEYALMTLAVQLGLAACIFAVFALRTAPEPLVQAASYFGWASIASIIWAAAMSIGVASFGASTHSVLKALERYRQSR